MTAEEVVLTLILSDNYSGITPVIDELRQKLVKDALPFVVSTMT